MRRGENLYSQSDRGDLDRAQGPTVFVSHRSRDKPAARAVSHLLRSLGVHVWLDEDDADLRIAKRRGEFGAQGIVHSIERGVKHSSNLLGLLSPRTMGSWWVPYEIGYSRAADKVSSFVISASDARGIELPEFISTSPTYWSVDELARWAATLNGNNLHFDLRDVPARVFGDLARHFALDPPELEIDRLCERGLEAINRLADPVAEDALALTSDSFDWLPTTGGLIREIAYDLLAPLAFAKFTASRATGAGDLLDIAYAALISDHELARYDPCIDYRPWTREWRTQRYLTPSRSWMQGLEERQLSERLERFMMTRDRNHDLRIATKEEFKTEFDRILRSRDGPDRRALGVLVNPLFGFSKKSRPVFWRVLAVQYLIYSTLLGRDATQGPFEIDVLRLGRRFAEEQIR